MDICETCGNHYERVMAIRVGGKEHFFDCFDFAIHAHGKVDTPQWSV